MAPVVFGLDLAELQWSKFKSDYMWNKEYHLRRTKFIVYQCALIFCVVSESLGTDVLSDYIQMERKIQTITANKVKVYNNDYVGAASYNIFAGVYVAFIFGAAFFFDLFWPERKESKGVLLAWKICGVLAVIFHLADAITLTVITATHRSTIVPHIPPYDQKYWWRKYHHHGEAPLVYRHNARALAAVVFAWVGWLSVAGSCVLLFLGIENTVNGPGPKSQHAREREEADGVAPNGSASDDYTPDTEKSLSKDESAREPSDDPLAPEAATTRIPPFDPMSKNAPAAVIPPAHQGVTR